MSSMLGQTTFSFQSTRPRGARHPQSHAPRMPATCFNPRAREGRDRSCLSCGAFHLPFQSTRPRGARHRVGMQDMGALRVSIHAPARGATARSLPQPSQGRVSIHAPARGATGFSTGFQQPIVVSIHAPARGATFIVCALPVRTIVSIHAPARGATSKMGPHTSKMPCFNPRAREGRDFFRLTIQVRNKSFNPRAREGRDAFCHCLDTIVHSFNPRAREGRDRYMPIKALGHVTFQSTRPRGARLRV